ncbi:autophagy-related protein 27 [Xylariaceae sp. FL0804]|nr:autophagy-related protein 27 [Xylariaceae sp. FL0804]
MKFAATHAADAALLAALLLSPLPAAAMLDCKRVVAGKQLYNLEKLGGPHSVVMSRAVGDIAHNTTYTVDICQPLRKKGDAKSTEQCKNGSRVCAIKRLVGIGGDDADLDAVEKVTPIAGELADHGGGPLDHEVTLLGDADADSDKTGLRLVMKGGFDRTDSGVKRKQQAVIDFICDESRNGTEGEYNPKDDKYEGSENMLMARADPLLFRAADEGDDDAPPPKEVQLGIENEPSLIFNSYGPVEGDSGMDELHLTWSSQYVCGDRDDDGENGQRSSHWGFFTWLVILIFLGTAAYLIFGSWLNYNRYGARGWDLLPHGDTIRDIPYLLKDWTRRVLNTMQGSGSRGGYSAV